MKNSKYWAFAILFALFINLSHEFITFHDQSSHSSIQDHVVNSSHSIQKSDICGYCSCFHLNFTLNEFYPIISQVEITKPYFSQQNIIILLNKLTLYKPPIA